MEKNVSSVGYRHKSAALSQIGTITAHNPRTGCFCVTRYQTRVQFAPPRARSVLERRARRVIVGARTPIAAPTTSYKTCKLHNAPSLAAEEARRARPAMSGDQKDHPRASYARIQ